MSRICIIAPSNQMGGIERALSVLSAHFVMRGHDVTYIACRAGNHFYQLQKEINYIEPSFQHATGFFKKFITYWNIIRFIRRNIKQIKPDTIMSFGDIINPFAIIANYGLGFPIYISDRISPKQRLGKFQNLIKYVTYSHATGFIAQSKMAADYKYKIFGQSINLRIIPNSLRDIQDYPCLKKEKWVFAMGRLSYEKGFDRLIEAFSRISGHKEWRLVLAGNGKLLKQLRHQAESLGILDRVDFLGIRKDVDYLMAKSSLFVIPSRCEGFPNALAEAMASPLPCISFDSISATEIIENRVNGIVIPEGDIDTLAREMEILMNDKLLREKYAANAYLIRERLDKDKIGDMYLGFILEGLNNVK